MFYWHKRESWGEPSFQKKYGSLIEGYITDGESKWQIVALMVLFKVRRVIFVVSVLKMNEMLSFQLGLIQLIVFLNLSLILSFPVFKSRQKTFIEIMNELTLLAATYFALMFSDLVFNPEERYSTGFVYIGLMSTNFAVQLVLIIIN